MTLPEALLGNVPSVIWQAFWVFLRVGGAFAVLPAFGERSVPLRVRLVLALAFTAVIAPAISAPADPPGTLGIGSELAIGVALGMAIRLFVMALQTAGVIAAQSTSLAQLFASGNADPQPAISHFLVSAGLALAVMLGLHVQVAHYFIVSYDMLPIGAALQSSTFTGWAVDRIAHAFGLSFSLAAPFAIVGLVYNLALGAINKAMPQLMVAFVGAPAISGAALALLALSAPFVLGLWHAQLEAFLANPVGMP
ncbi:MAG: flagellar biosynthetic protein FliR [Rhodobacteraceae bacterium]|nr:flagellar biosynthetic protein FliR [Paracoccaceae bacterium]